MRFWVDIESGGGVRQGAGPITSASEAEITTRLDRAGTVSFRMPGADPKAALVQLKRAARIRGLVNGVVTDLGLGIVDEKRKRPEASGKLDFQVSGDDRLRELVDRHVGELLISDGAGGPDDDGPSEIMSLAPTGWTLDTTTGYNTTIKTIFHQFDGETVLAALIRIAELTGEHFRLVGTGQTVIWLRKLGSAKLTHAGITGTYTPGETVTGGTSGATGTVREATGGGGAGYLYVEDVSGDFVAGETVTGGSSGATCTVGTAYNPASGIRAIQGGDPIALESNPLVCLITPGGLEETEDSYESLVGRVYALGSGLGAAKLELNGVTISPPAGYTLGNDAKGYYLEHTTTWAAYGVERRLTFKDIENVDELYEQAYEYLSRAKDAHTAYRLEVTKLDVALLPGQTLRVVYRRVVDGVAALNIDQDMMILEATNRIEQDGLLTVRLMVSTVDRWPVSETDALLKTMQQDRQLATHSQPVPADDLGDHAASHQDGGGDEINVGGLSGELADAQPPKNHKIDHEEGGSDALSGTLSITDLKLSGKITQGSQVVSAFFTKTIVDATPTSIFRIATTNEAGNTDGGGYSVLVHALIDHSCTNDTTNAAAKSFTAQFCRAMIATGTGVSSAVSEVVETAQASTNPLRTIDAVTMTVVETSEYNIDVQFTVDLGGLGVGTGKVHIWVQVVWAGFLTPPVLSQL